MENGKSSLEVQLTDGTTIDLVPKSMYVILENESKPDENRPDLGYSKIIVPWAKQDKPYLLITTVRPDVLEKFGVDKIKQEDYMRLTPAVEETDSYTTIPIDKAPQICNVIAKWGKTHGDAESIVYIDKFAFQEFVTTHNMKQTQNTIKSIIQEIEKTGKILVLSIDPRAYEEETYKPSLRQLVTLARSTGGCELDEARIKY